MLKPRALTTGGGGREHPIMNCPRPSIAPAPPRLLPMRLENPRVFLLSGQLESRKNRAPALSISLFATSRGHWFSSTLVSSLSSTPLSLHLLKL